MSLLEKQKLTLLDRRCQKREFEVPGGWVHKAAGAAQRGDRWWRWNDESWQPIDEHAFLGSDVRLLQAVITRAPEPEEQPAFRR